MDKWISVESSLPTTHIEVLLIHATGPGESSAIFMGYRSGNFWFEAHYYCPKNVTHKIPSDQITHWRPLPNVPQSTGGSGK